MEIHKNITSKNYSLGASTDRIKYIVIHYTGNDGDTAKANTDYFKSISRAASAHYFVDENEIWQCVDDRNIAWHCGTNGAYRHSECRNKNSIGIEICSRKRGGEYFFLGNAVKNAVELTKDLMNKYNVPITNVIRHYDVTGKLCPEPYVRNESLWAAFKNALMDNQIEEYTDINDIAWELQNRGIVIDTQGLIDEVAQEPNGRLYWLARKAVQYIREAGE